MASFSFFRKSFVESVKKRLFHTFGIEEFLIKRLENISILKPTAIQEKVSRVARAHVLNTAQKIELPSNISLLTPSHKLPLFQ